MSIDPSLKYSALCQKCCCNADIKPTAVHLGQDLGCRFLQITDCEYTRIESSMAICHLVRQVKQDVEEDLK
jgi:hypothetical protein